MKQVFLHKMAALIMVTAIVTGFVFSPGSAEAASAKTKIKKLVANMSTYEYVMLFDTGLSEGESYEVVLSDTEKAVAAAFTTPLNEDTYVGEVGDLGWQYLYSVSNKRIKSMSKKMFGKAVSYKKIPKGSFEDTSFFLDVYRTDEGKVMLYIWEGETETDFETRKQTIVKDGKGYKVVRDVYHGYWGWNDGKTANYRITYKVEKNPASSYGYVITGMKLESI